LSGQFVKTHGIAANFIREREDEAPNLGRTFRDGGYQCALIGKAHLPAKWVREGFEYVRLSDLADASVDDPRTCHYFNDLVEAGLADDYDQGTLMPGHPGCGMRSFISRLPEEYSLEAWTGREARGFLARRDRERPFFLKVSFQRPHDPYAPPAARAHEYAPEALSLPDNADDFLRYRLKGKPKAQQQYAAGELGVGYPFRPRDAEDLKLQMARHFTLITMIDEAIGGILADLKAAGDLDNTLIVYVADHGDFAGEHGMMLKNLGIYESIHNIPLIIAGPGVPAGQVRDAFFESVDFFPTLCELTGLTADPAVDGVSRVPELEGAAPRLEQTVCEWLSTRGDGDEVHAVRAERYRYVVYDNAPVDGELYDHRTDPGEMVNLFHDPDCQDVVRHFQQVVEAYRKGAVRRQTPADDACLAKQYLSSPTLQLHQGGACWSELVSRV
jgi:choline-sulfatase/uncharacterized sulfatase